MQSVTEKNKHKPRTRNRPKNKANRAQINNNNNNNDNEAPADAAAAATTKVNTDNEQKLEPKEEACEAIKLIQKLLREKFLAKCEKQQKQQQQQQCNALVTEEQTRPKDSKSMSRVECVKDKASFLSQLQKKMENAILEKGNEIPATATLYNNLEKILNQPLVSDIVSSDGEDEGDEAEYIEYVYKPRDYFLVSLCNLCKTDLCQTQWLPCTRCGLTYYCSKEHMQNDKAHRQMCYALKQVAETSGMDIFNKCGDFTVEQFRSFRIINIRKVETAMNRQLSAAEQEVLLFPRICTDTKCREHRFVRLSDCARCGQAAFCKAKPAHFDNTHKYWCESFQLFKQLVQFQAKFGRLEPSLPTKVLQDLPINCCNTKQVLSKLEFNMLDMCEYAALSQISTGPLTAWYSLKLCECLKLLPELTIHLIGAELEFEVDLLHKWELFFLHITPAIKRLNVVFVGPELNPRNISFEQLKKTKCCHACRRNQRTVNYFFENQLYHNYCETTNFMRPNLVCFFNAGLYRSTGYALEDTWPETIQAAAHFKCPVVVTSYTKYEAPLDMSRFVQESNRRLNVVLPPTINPFASNKPERNFISDEEAPLIFKNYYCFVVE